MLKEWFELVLLVTLTFFLLVGDGIFAFWFWLRIFT
jgi:hypothetical protein